MTRLRDRRGGGAALFAAPHAVMFDPAAPRERRVLTAEPARPDCSAAAELTPPGFRHFSGFRAGGGERTGGGR